MYALSHLRHENGTWYWSVNFQRRGKFHARRFYGPKYGGPAKALEAATIWRDQQLATASTLTMVEFCQHKRSNNTSGVPGVHFLTSARQPDGFWQAKLTVGGGKYKSRNFSVLRHGEDKAYQLAVAERNRMLADLKDEPYVYDPVAKRMAPPTCSHG